MKALGRLIFWEFPRASWQYDVIVALILAFIFRVHLGWHLVLLIPAVLLMIAMTTAFSMVAAAMHVYFRDMRYVMQAVVVPWFYASAVFFPLSFLPHRIRGVVELNPATGMVLLFRSAIAGSDPRWRALAPDGRNLWLSLPWPFVWTAGLFLIAVYLYRRFDRVFVDLL